MNIEPIKNILEISNDKKNTILFFIDNQKIIDKLKNYELVNNYYINQNIIAIKKNNLSYDVIGQIIYIKNKKIGIKLKNNIVIYINPTLYYTFIKFNKNNNKQFFQQLLKNL